jgi:hypothetical protein
LNGPSDAAVRDAAVAALKAEVEYARAARQAVWSAPSQAQVERLIRSAWPAVATAERERAEAAEAKLAAIRTEVAHIPGDGINFTFGEQNQAETILAIIGSEEE